MFSNKKDEITLIINGEELDDSQAVSYLKSINHYKLKVIDISQEGLSSSQIAHLAASMDVKPRALIDQKMDKLINEVKVNKKIDDNGVLKILSENPTYMRTPITIWNGKTEYWDTAYDMIKLEMRLK